MLAAFNISLCISLGLELRKENLNVANIYLSGINLTKCKYKDRSITIRTGQDLIGLILLPKS